MPRNLLILYLSCGAGHKQAAHALHEAAVDRGDWERIESVDVARFYAPWFRLIYHESYLGAVRYLPSLADRLWRERPIYPGRETWTFPPSIIRRGARRFFDFIQSFQPSAVISTELAACELLALMPDARRAEFLSIAVLLDFLAVDPSWIKASIDFYCVPTNHEALLVQKMGIPEYRTVATGIPVRKGFSGAKRPDVRRTLNLPADKPVVLLMYGGMTGRLLKKSLRLSLGTVDATHVVLSGTNRRDADGLRAIGHRNLRVIGWIDNVADWMNASDLLVSKPGGVTLGEAFSAHLPLVLFNPLGWWERANMRLAVDSGAALEANSVDEIPERVMDVLFNTARSVEIKQQAAKLASPFAAERIVD